MININEDLSNLTKLASSRKYSIVGLRGSYINFFFFSRRAYNFIDMNMRNIIFRNQLNMVFITIYRLKHFWNVRKIKWLFYLNPLENEGSVERSLKNTALFKRCYIRHNITNILINVKKCISVVHCTAQECYIIVDWLKYIT